MLPIINSMIQKIGGKGCLLALDSLPPFIIRFDFPMQNYKKTKSPHWEYVGTPSGRVKYPVYAGMGEEVISFTLLFDTINRNDSINVDSIGGRVGLTPYKGVNPISQYVQNATSMDYISHIKSLFSKIISPRVLPSAFSRTKAGGIVNISQGQSEPTPHLTLFIKNLAEAYVGYVTNADITETNTDAMGYVTRIVVNVEFAVIPDAFLQSTRDMLETIHSVRSLLPL